MKLALRRFGINGYGRNNVSCFTRDDYISKSRAPSHVGLGSIFTARIFYSQSYSSNWWYSKRS